MTHVATGVASVERVLLEVLRQGYAAVKSDTGIIDEIFCGLPSQEREDLKQFIEDKDMDVQLAYPLQDAKFPCWRIVLSRDRMVESFIGDLIQEQKVTGLGHDFEEELGELYEQSYAIYTFTDNGDLTAHMYNLLKLFMKTNRGLIEQVGFMDLSYSGNDLVRSAEVSPQIMYTRVYTITGKAFFSVPFEFNKIASASLENLDFEIGGDGC